MIQNYEALTRREHEVLALVGEGMSNQEISEKLGIKRPTVETHLYRIFRKLGVTNRTAAVRYAQRVGLIES